MAADVWTREDGHVLVVAEHELHIECTRPADCACPTACERCEGRRDVYEDDYEGPCPDCGGSGDASPRECFLVHHTHPPDLLDDDQWERRCVTGDPWPSPGRYVLEYRVEPEGEMYGRIGARLAAPGDQRPPE